MRRPDLGPLWRHADFRRLWAAQTVSQLGSQVSQLALPLTAVIALRASPFEVSALGAVDMLPFLLFALPAGVWVDRLPRRPVLVVGDLGRAVALTSIPLVAWIGTLTIWQLYVVGFLTGILTVFFDVAYQSYLPSLVERDDLVDANSKLEISRSGAQIAGPGLGGLLVGWLTAPYAIVVDAVSFIWSGALALRIQARETVDVAEDRNLRRELMEGLRYLLGHPLFRSLAAFVAVFNLGSGIVGPLIILYAVRRFGMTAAELGVAFMLGNIGWMLGATLARRVVDRFGIATIFAFAGVLGGAPYLLIPLAPRQLGFEFLIAAQALSSLGIVLFNIPGISLYQTLVPARMLGRMNASRRWIVWGVIPFGSLLGGALAAETSVRVALLAGAAIETASAAFLFAKPIRSLATVSGDARAPGDGGLAPPAE